MDEYDVYHDTTTGNMFVLRDGRMFSVNAIANNTPRAWSVSGKVFKGRVVDWRWECGLYGRWDNRTGATSAARYFGVAATPDQELC
jgi:hypothetical protein